jgi:hypothetical protein
MKTRGEAVALSRNRGRGPKDIHAYLLGDFVVVRLLAHTSFQPVQNAVRSVRRSLSPSMRCR